MIQPTSDIVLVEQDAIKEVNKSGIYIPESISSQEVTGRVFEVGPDVKGVTNQDRVLLLPVKYLSVKHNGKSYLVVREKEVIAIIS